MRRHIALLAAAISLCPLALAMPARAEIAAKSDNGFVTTATVDVAGKSPGEVWPVLLMPGKWWNPIHAWSGDAASMFLDAQAGGCFCELLPLPPGAPAGARRGSIEHARIVAAMPPRLLRMIGALGPLQGESLAGALTVTLKPEAGGTRMTWTYVVGGYMRMKVDDIAPIVDRVLAEQATRLAEFALAVPQPAAAKGRDFGPGR